MFISNLIKLFKEGILGVLTAEEKTDNSPRDFLSNFGGWNFV